MEEWEKKNEESLARLGVFMTALKRAFCDHEWHADQDNYCNFCVKCGARQEIYLEEIEE